MIHVFMQDEAHRGTGDYAYAQIIRFLMAKNPHFRVLALTATPGGTPDAVQAIIDSLHISRIELRDENSLDLKGYVFKKVSLAKASSRMMDLISQSQNIKQHVIKMSEDIDTVKELLGKLMHVCPYLICFIVIPNATCRMTSNNSEIAVCYMETEVLSLCIRIYLKPPCNHSNETKNGRMARSRDCHPWRGPWGTWCGPFPSSFFFFVIEAI